MFAWMMCVAVLLLVMSMLCAPVETIRLCGAPPRCYCYPLARVLDCPNIAEMPRFRPMEARQYQTVLLRGTLSRIPDLALFENLAKVNVERTAMPCSQIRRWREWAPYTVKAPRCANATGMYFFLNGMLPDTLKKTVLKATDYGWH